MLLRWYIVSAPELVCLETLGKRVACAAKANSTDEKFLLQSKKDTSRYFQLCFFDRWYKKRSSIVERKKFETDRLSSIAIFEK